jgi:hypothetical protein
MGSGDRGTVGASARAEPAEPGHLDNVSAL